MQFFRVKYSIVLVIATGIAVAAYAQEAHRPEHKPQNLKVLPQNIAHDSLIAVMHYWENALGVNCGYCHAPSANGNGRLDFASDENRKKDIARHMLTMTDSINAQYFSWWNSAEEGRATAVNCYTCHHGHAEPEALMQSAEKPEHGAHH